MGNSTTTATESQTKRMGRNTQFKLQMTEFKRIADQYLNKMTRYNIKDQKNRKASYQIAQSIMKMFDRLCERYLGSGDKNGDQQSHPLEQASDKEVKDLELKIQRLTRYQLDQKRFHPDLPTSLAFKNESSFMISTSDLRVRVIEDGSEIFMDDYEIENCGPSDIIYCKNINAYLLALDRKIYRKDIDGGQLYLFLDINCGSSIGASLRFSDIHQRLVIPKDRTNIASINLETKKIEIEVPMPNGDGIMDFQLHGLAQNLVTSLTQYGHLLVSELAHLSSKGKILTKFSIELSKANSEHAETVVVCPLSQYIFVEIYQRKHPFLCSKMMIFSFRNKRLSLQAKINPLSSQRTGCKSAMTCLGYFKRNLVFLGLSLEIDGVAQLYSFNPETKHFEELKQARERHQELNPFTILRLGNRYYYTGVAGKIMRLSLTFKSD